MIKRILIFIATFLIAMSGFLTGFFSVGCMSVYASVNDDSVYVPLRSESDAVKAFQAYCKSRDLTIEGSLTDAVTTFTTGVFNSACNEIGIDITELQAEIKAEYDQSGEPVKFLLNDTGIMAMNRIFAQFLQDNELEVGDQVDDEIVDSGYYFRDDEGFGCFAYVINWYSDDTVSFSKAGTPYLYDSDDFMSSTPINITRHYQNFAYKVVSSYSGGTSRFRYYLKYNDSFNYNIIWGGTDYSYSPMYSGYPAVAYNTANNKFVLGCYVYDTGGTSKFFKPLLTIEKPNQQGTAFNIIITTNNNTINNNTYEGDTIINNEGDIINNPQPSQPNDPNNTIHNVPETPLSPNDDGGWDIDLPDIDIPNLPIGNLSEKFPFSIPWDLVAFYAMLDAEPEAPRFNGTMDLTLVQWNYDIDLSPFDSAAELCRKLQFGLFVVGLIVASRSIIRG